LQNLCKISVRKTKEVHRMHISPLGDPMHGLYHIYRYSIYRHWATPCTVYIIYIDIAYIATRRPHARFEVRAATRSNVEGVGIEKHGYRSSSLYTYIESYYQCIDLSFTQDQCKELSEWWSCPQGYRSVMRWVTC